MAEEKNEVSRREAIKSIGLGVGVIASLPVLRQPAAAQDHAHNHAARPAPQAPPAQPLKFFTPEENRLVIEMSERIIPADDHSPGARAARVNEFIDLILSQSPEVTRRNWREGMQAVEKMSRDKFGKAFADASEAQQIELLTEISKNERSPQTVEERFFRLIKNATIDGYYTSEIGIQQELRYKGNTYLKEFKGCTHPEHQS